MASIEEELRHEFGAAMDNSDVSHACELRDATD